MLRPMTYCSCCGAKVRRAVPSDDNRERWVCSSCEVVHYQNPQAVVGCIAEQDGKILLCKRSIEPRYGYWTVPAGFMELGESLAQGAARETLEEACAEVEMGHLFAAIDVVDAGQVHFFFTAKLVGGHAAGAESLDTRLFAEDEIPWDDIAFRSGRYALERYLEDRGASKEAHIHELRRAELKNTDDDA